MTSVVSRRCFDCGAQFAGPTADGPPPLFCPNDALPLGLEVVGRRWRLEGYLGPRISGGLFIAYHLVTGVRGAVSLVFDAQEGELERRLGRELQAQRLIEPHPNLFKLLELGSERDGTRFFVFELHAEQPLREALKEWKRPANAAALFSQAASLLRPLLGLLATAHRLGIAHGEIDASQVYVTVVDAADGEDPLLVGPRLYGLQRLGSGPALVEAVRTDLFALGRLFHVLLFGEPPPWPLPLDWQTAIRAQFGEVAGGFVLRALGGSSANGEGPFTTVDEMQRALVALRGEASSDGYVPAIAICEPIDPVEEITSPNAAPSRMSDPRRLSTISRPAPSPSESSLPEPTQPGSPQRFRLSGELPQVSLSDLLAGSATSMRNEVMARGRYQTSLQEGMPSPVRRRSAVSDSLDLEIELGESSLPESRGFDAERRAPFVPQPLKISPASELLIASLSRSAQASMTPALAGAGGGTAGAAALSAVKPAALSLSAGRPVWVWGVLASVSLALAAALSLLR